MAWHIFIPAFVLGIISSFHCIGMCGPIALLLPVGGLNPRQKLLSTLLYNSGRIVTYALLGLLLGLIGRKVFVAGFQQTFSIVLGITILIVLLLFYTHNRIFHKELGGILFRQVKRVIGQQMKSPNRSAMFITGLANGLLPCGMVYFALAGALAGGSIPHSVTFMAAFGLGTVPLMMLVTQFGTMVSFQIRNHIKTATPFFIGGIGVLLILRGMNLDIPYISPLLNRLSGEVIPCH